MEAVQDLNYLKSYRTRVLLFDEGTTGGTNTFGRYYFDEIRELVGKTIVGINVDLGNTSALDPGNISFDDYTGFAANFRYQNATKFDLPYFFLNLYNDQKELIMENFPCYALTDVNLNSGINGNANPILTRPGQKYIYPLNTKINVRASYIFGNANLTPDNVVISVTFYYK